MQIHLSSIGCRLNWSEIEVLARRFRAAGCTVVSKPDRADLCVVNTCAVTAQAERKTRHHIRWLNRQNPDARIAVVGCYATLRRDTAASFPGVAWTVPNVDKAHTAGIVGATVLGADASPPPTGGSPLRTRAFVKVQDGCDNHCTYCIVRFLRGASRSRPVAEVVAEVQARVEHASAREAVLTGASLGAYGRDLGVSGGLRTLVEALLADTDIGRLRLSSLEPWDIDETFFELWEDPRLCRQIHLPLQAGCDGTLRRMGRPITTERFARLVGSANAAIPDLAVTTDILVGFPGEDEDAFVESYQFVEQAQFAKLHVFPYSSRPGTHAARLPRQVPGQIRQARARRLREMAATLRQRYQSRFLGREMAVLWEGRTGQGQWVGWTDNYIRVVAGAKADLCGKITQARLLALENGQMRGEAIL
jgi:threonylcarbamoyladenosine tRNA methylthiotransferase MtaB